MITHSPSATLLEARASYFAQAGFKPDGGYNDRWVELRWGPLPVYFPNFPARVRAVKLHDLHHVATGYQTTNLGEAEIGSWEVGSHCGTFWAAWMLNLMAMSSGVLLGPRRTLQAYARGRRSQNLYRRPWDEAMLTLTVAELRAALGVDAPVQITARDVAGWVAWTLTGVLVTALVFLPGILLVGLLLHALL